MKILKNIAAILISLAFTAVALEIGVRIVLRYRSYYDVEMWKYGTILKRQAADPALSHEHVPGGKARLYGVDIEINSKGLRDREYSYEPSPDTHRILFLGDSLTLGWGVAAADTFEKRLEPMLSRVVGKPVEVINTGVGNYNSAQEAAYYRDEGYKYHPDHLMLLYFINDAEPTPIYKSVTLKEHSMLVVFMWSRITKLLTRLNVQPDFRGYYEALYDESSAGWQATVAALRTLKQQADAQHIPFTVFVCPELRQLDPYPFAKEHRQVLSLLESEAIEHVDLLPRFRAQAGREPTLWVSQEDSHPNALGHEIIAAGVEQYVSAERHATRP